MPLSPRDLPELTEGERDPTTEELPATSGPASLELAGHSRAAAVNAALGPAGPKEIIMADPAEPSRKSPWVVLLGIVTALGIVLAIAVSRMAPTIEETVTPEPVAVAPAAPQGPEEAAAEVVSLSLDEIAAALEDGGVRDAKTLLGLCSLLRRLGR